MTTPHKHAEVIKAWADGAIIEVKTIDGDWVEVHHSPTWYSHSEYRVKPHKHAEVMQAFKEGKRIEYSFNGENWRETNNPCWDENTFYRVVPETVTIQRRIILMDSSNGHYPTWYLDNPNVELKFNKSTGELLEINLIKKD